MEITDRIYAGLKRVWDLENNPIFKIVGITDRIYAGLKLYSKHLLLFLFSSWELQTGFMRD